MLASSILVLFSAIVLITFVVRKILRTSSRPRTLPPGPNPLPLVGNLFDLPKDKLWIRYHEMSKTYGDMTFFDVPVQPILVINSPEVALELLDKRSEIYSDRLEMRMSKLMTWDFAIPLMRYGNPWRERRRLFHQSFKQDEDGPHRNVQREETQLFLWRVLEKPEKAPVYAQQLLASMILRVVYGMEIKNLETDSFIALTRKAMRGASLAMTPGQNWVEFLSFLQHIPSWLPGGNTQRLVQEYRPIVQDIINKPFQKVKDAMDNGGSEACILELMLTKLREQYKGGPIPVGEDTTVKEVAAVLYFAGVDTTSAAVAFVLLALAMHPEVQTKAQEELDRIVGPNRLPEVSDFDSLVYIRAVAMESLRWIPVTPMALPHRLSEDDWYRGYFIPKGTVVFANSWAMLRNPIDYPDPEAFKPERFIKDGKINTDVRHPDTLAFGYGRRKCPGRVWATSSLTLFIASVLHVFNITPGLDDEGKPVQLSKEASSEFVSHPTTMPRGFTPRSEAAERLIHECVAHLQGATLEA